MEAKREAELEHALRRAALAGDESAWRTLYERSFDPLFAWVFRRCDRRRQEAEEAVQECWLVAVRRIRKFDPGRGSFLSWLIGVSENVLRNRWRGDQRRERREREHAASESGRDPESRSLEVSEQISVAMAALDGRHRAILKAKYEEQLTVAEIAARWQESAKAIESLLSRARAAFRGIYRGIGGS